MSLVDKLTNEFIEMEIKNNRAVNDDIKDLINYFQEDDIYGLFKNDDYIYENMYDLNEIFKKSIVPNKKGKKEKRKKKVNKRRKNNKRIKIE